MEQRQRNPNGTFVKGGSPPEKARRAKGIQNKITRDIREGAIAGFARHGSNGRGEGFSGFCYYLAKRHPKAAVRIIEKLLPLNINATAAGASIHTVNIVSIPSGEHLTKDAIARLQQSQLLEHEPQPSPQLELIAAPCDEPAAPDVIDEPSTEPAPEPVQEPNPVVRRAMALGFVPLPRRPPKDW